MLLCAERSREKANRVLCMLGSASSMTFRRAPTSSSGLNGRPKRPCAEHQACSPRTVRPSRTRRPARSAPRPRTPGTCSIPAPRTARWARTTTTPRHSCGALARSPSCRGSAVRPAMYNVNASLILLHSSSRIFDWGCNDGRYPPMQDPQPIYTMMLSHRLCRSRRMRTPSRPRTPDVHHTIRIPGLQSTLSIPYFHNPYHLSVPTSQPQPSPHARPDHLLILAPPLPPHARRIHIRRALVVGLRQHAHHADEDLLHALDRAPPLRRLLVVVRVVAGRVQDRDADEARRVDLCAPRQRRSPNLVLHIMPHHLHHLRGSNVSLLHVFSNLCPCIGKITLESRLR